MIQTRSYPAAAVSVTGARAFVVMALRAYPQDIVEKAELMVSELATNALHHTTDSFTVNVTTTEDHIRVAVTDTGGGRPEKRSPSSLEPSGRGLQVVEALADHWDVTPARPVGKTVAFVLSVDQDHK